jgi:hypothetical protein
VTNTEFTDDPICTASRQYQALKVAQLEASDLSPDDRERHIRKVTEKACLCEDLACATIVGDGPVQAAGKKPAAVAVCPGPNLAYFTKVVSLEEMVSHIYGRLQLITSPDRPHMFVNELRLYVDHLKKEIERRIGSLSPTDLKFLTAFRANLQDGIAYYHDLAPRLDRVSEEFRRSFRRQLDELEAELMALVIPVAVAVPV